ncbi:hypothetical protein COU54_00625 [Candidatus Pacearchaeota archaeon CG10_big_fil_rev_8_21_14_0_10_31_24]|nr:MAG: hypothetical protein COU54_00625 [Candidatus Pacearchaeota archaeon CG10_big_fil_rev_8_21_14_0_10_31_24]
MNRKRLSELFNEVVEIVGPNLDDSLPLELYDFSRRYSQTYCVDGVPVLSDGPEVILSKRQQKGLLPGFFWIIGGRVEKGVFRETEVLERKFKSELGATVKIDEQDFIGRGRLIMLSNTKENEKNYTINTPTMVYAVKIQSAVLDTLKSGDGNETWSVRRAEEIVKDSTLHPYVRNSSLVAVDKVHGTSWRHKLDYDLRNIGYPKDGEELAQTNFIPLIIAQDYLGRSF